MGVALSASQYSWGVQLNQMFLRKKAGFTIVMQISPFSLPETPFVTESPGGAARKIGCVCHIQKLPGRRGVVGTAGKRVAAGYKWYEFIELLQTRRILSCENSKRLEGLEKDVDEFSDTRKWLDLLIKRFPRKLSPAPEKPMFWTLLRLFLAERVVAGRCRLAGS